MALQLYMYNNYASSYKFVFTMCLNLKANFNTYTPQIVSYYLVLQLSSQNNFNLRSWVWGIAVQLVCSIQ